MHGLNEIEQMNLDAGYRALARAKRESLTWAEMLEEYDKALAHEARKAKLNVQDLQDEDVAAHNRVRGIGPRHAFEVAALRVKKGDA
jgi:hypothetical protein